MIKHGLENMHEALLSLEQHARGAQLLNFADKALKAAGLLRDMANHPDAEAVDKLHSDAYAAEIAKHAAQTAFDPSKPLEPDAEAIKRMVAEDAAERGEPPAFPGSAPLGTSGQPE